MYVAVATVDPVTLVRSAIRRLIRVAGGALAAELRAVLARGDYCAAAGKPACDYADEAARVELVDSLAFDGHAVLTVLDGRDLCRSVNRAAGLLASVVGQDLVTEESGVFRIARRVGDLVVSTVSPEVLHGGKSSATGFDGY